ncbi:hypothetical protein AgCh_040310 [Apium graveolens]
MPASNHDSIDDDPLISIVGKKKLNDNENEGIHEGASPVQDAPSPHSVSEFKKRARESIYSPQKSDPSLEHWKHEAVKLDFNWEEHENTLPETEKKVWRNKEKNLACVGLDPPMYFFCLVFNISARA